MDLKQTVLLQDVIDDLINSDKSLTAPLMRLSLFSQLIKNDPLIRYIKRELEGYTFVEDDEIPDYRKTPGTLYLDLYLLGETHTQAASASLLGEEQRSHLQYLVFREAIATIEQMAIDRSKPDQTDKQIVHPLPVEILHLFEKRLKKTSPGSRVRVVGAMIAGSAYKLIEVLPIVRSRLLNFTIEVAEEFGVQIDVSAFNKKRDQNNQIIFHIMNKTEITNNGDGNVTNTGDHSKQTVNISINKGDWQKLSKTLLDHGIEEADISKLKAIVETEKPDGSKFGSKALDWITKVSGKAIQGVGKITTGVSSNLLATWIRSFYGM